MKNPGARPTKINDNILNAFKDVLAEGMNVLIMTDEELCILVNEKLNDEDKFSYTTFKNWKALHKKNDLKDETAEYNVDKYKKILALIKKALLIQKNNLFNKLTTEKEWTKWAWIIERKFDAWNIRHKTEDLTPQRVNKIELEIIKSNDIKNKDNGVIGEELKHEIENSN